MSNLSHFFSNPIIPAQKQYEALRAIVVEKLPAEVVAKKFEYSVHTLYSLMRDAKAGRLELFPDRGTRGPKQRQTPDYICSLILTYSCYARSILSSHIFKLLPGNLVGSNN